MIHREPLLKHHEPLVKHHETLLKHCETLELSSFDATISVLDAEMSALGAAIAQRSFGAPILALDAETSAPSAATSAIARSYWRYRRGVFSDCGVGITPQMCNRVTNHWDMGTFSKPAGFFLLVGRYVPTKVIRVRNKDKPWFDDQSSNLGLFWPLLLTCIVKLCKLATTAKALCWLINLFYRLIKQLLTNSTIESRSKQLCWSLIEC